MKFSEILKLQILILSFILCFSSCAKKTNLLETQLSLSNPITFLILGTNEDKKIVFSSLAILIPNSRKLGFFFINPYAIFEGDTEKIEDWGSNTHRKLTSILEKMTHLKVNHYVYISEKVLGKWIDFIGGIHFYFDPVTPRESEIFLRSIGVNLMFGEEVIDLLQRKNSPEIVDSYIDRMNFQQSVLLSIYDKIYETGELKKEWILFFHRFLDTNLTAQEIYSLYKFILKERIVIAINEMPAKLFIEEKTGNQKLIAEHKSIHYNFEKLITNITLKDYAYGELARTEILNATNRSGLAKEVKSILNEQNFSVLSVGNSWSLNEPNSFLIDRSGNPEFTYKVGKILNIKKIFHLVDKEVGLDTTVILGEDFEIRNKK